MAKNYVDEIRNKIESDIVLIGYDLNRNINIFYDNQNMYKNILNTQKLVRNVDEIHLIDSSGNLIISTLDDNRLFEPPDTKALEIVFNKDTPLKIINAFENKLSDLFPIVIHGIL